MKKAQRSGAEPARETLIDFWPGKWVRQEDFWKGITANLITAYIATAIALELTSLAHAFKMNDSAMAWDSLKPALWLTFALSAVFIFHVLKKWSLRRRPTEWGTAERLAYGLTQLSLATILIGYSLHITTGHIVSLMEALD